MPRAALIFAAGLLVLAGSLTGALAQTGASSAEEVAAGRALVLQAEVWTDPSGRADIREVAARMDDWQPFAGTIDVPSGGMGAVWLRLLLAPKLPGDLYVELQYPSTDTVDLYQRDPSGVWQVQRSGDRIATRLWPVRDRLPVVRVARHQAGDWVYVRVTNATAMRIGTRWLTEDEMAESRKLVYLLMGVYLGLGGLAFGAAAATTWVYRDRAMGLYALYVLGMMLTQAASQGVGGQFLWPMSPDWNHWARVVLTWVTVGLGMWTCLEVADLRTLQPRLHRPLAALAMFQIVLAPLSMAMPDQVALVALNLSALAAMLLSLAVLIHAHQRGNRHALGTAIAFLPILIGSTAPILRNVNLVAHDNWWTHYAFALGAAIEIPLLLWVLLRRSRDLREFAAADDARSPHDKLTGLINAETALARLEQTAARARRYGHQSALLVFDLANLEAIDQQHGRDVAELALAEVARRLRPVARDVDSLARLRGGRFALIAEGPLPDPQIADMATRIVARGLVLPTPLPEQTTLQFRVAVARLGPRVGSTLALLERAQDLLVRMRSNGKSIRWLDEAPPPAPAPAGGVLAAVQAAELEAQAADSQLAGTQDEPDGPAEPPPEPPAGSGAFIR